MITTDELKVQLAEYHTAVKDLEEALAIDASRKRVQELEHTMSRPGFYDDAELSKKVFDEVGDLKGKLTRFEKLQGLYDDAETMLVMLDEEYDPEMVPEAEEAVNAVGKAVDELQLMTMLNGEYDHSNAILTFHAGTGGTEAQDWAEMLYRMYNKWAQAHGMTVEVLDYQDGDEAGMKSASMMVKGANAYGLLKSENGVHRLVRVSPFDANARRQTSFASLEVMPELDNTIQVDIRPEDIEMQVYRSSGAGGQHINKTSSAVRLIHKPTGVVVSCQTLRSYKGKTGTSCPNVADWLAAYEGAEEVFVVTITGTLSGSYNAAQLAAEEYRQEHEGARVFVLDSLSAGPECRLLAERLAALVQAGCAFDDAAEKILAYHRHTHLLFSLESLANLARNGRVKPAVAAVARMLGIRVIGQASEAGELEVLCKTRGEHGALERIVLEMKGRGFVSGRVHIAHCGNPDAADRLKKMLHAVFPGAQVDVSPCGGLCSYYAELGGLMVGYEDNEAPAL